MEFIPKTGKRESKRPLSKKQPMHLILKSDSRKFVYYNKVVREEIHRAADKWHIRIHRVGVESDHIHVSVRVSSRENYRRFIQRVTGVLAKKLKIKWIQRPYTKIVEWGRQFRYLMIIF